MTPRRTIAAVVASVAALGLAACGDDGAIRHAESEGQYVTVDNLRYQVQISRQLNPTDTEDRDYLRGVPASQATLASDEVWFGIFIRVANNHNHGADLPTAPSFEVSDTADNRFRPIPTDNLISYKPTSLGAKQTLPHGTEAASYAPTQGKLLLFKMPDSSLANRPLELTIRAATGCTKACSGTIQIDV